MRLNISIILLFIVLFVSCKKQENITEITDLKTIDALLKEDSTNSELFKRKAEILFELKKYASVVPQINYAIKNDNNNQELYCYRGVSYFALNKYDSAIIDFKKSIEVEKNEAAYGWLCKTFLFKGLNDSVIYYANSAKNNNLNSFVTKIFESTAYFNKKDSSNANNVFLSIDENEVPNVHYLDYLRYKMKLNLRSNNMEEVIKSYDILRKKYPNSASEQPQISYILKSYIRLGQVDSAKKYYRILKGNFSESYTLFGQYSDLTTDTVLIKGLIKNIAVKE